MAKRANGEGTIRKRSDGRWEARYLNPVDNKQHSVYGKTQKEAREKLQLKMRQIINEGIVIDTDIKVCEWCELWLANYTSDIKTLSISSYKSIIKNHITPAIGDIKLKALTSNDVQRLYNNLSRKRGEGQKLSPKTIRNIHGVVHKMLKKAVDMKYISSNVSDKCVIPKVQKKEICPLDEEQIEMFLCAIKGEKYEPIYIVTLFLGLRQGEVLGLTWDNIDFHNNTIFVEKQLLRDLNKPLGEQFCFASLKNDKPRMLVAPKCVMDILKRQREFQQRQRPYWTNQDKQWENLVFTNDEGSHLYPWTVRDHYKKIVSLIGVPKSRFHDLRHSFAVIALQNGDDIKTVQTALGHHSSAFTLQTYAHATWKMKTDSADRMDRFVENMGIAL